MPTSIKTSKAPNDFGYCSPKNAQQLLGKLYTLPEEHRKGIAETTCGARSALNCKPLRSLKDAFKQIDDSRTPQNRHHPLSALLGMTT